LQFRAAATPRRGATLRWPRRGLGISYPLASGRQRHVPHSPRCAVTRQALFGEVSFAEIAPVGSRRQGAPKSLVRSPSPSLPSRIPGHHAWAGGPGAGICRAQMQRPFSAWPGRVYDGVHANEPSPGHRTRVANPRASMEGWGRRGTCVVDLAGGIVGGRLAGRGSRRGNGRCAVGRGSICRRTFRGRFRGGWTGEICG
jgi:hypothetical protein